jgi:DNA gyrase subunit A
MSVIVGRALPDVRDGLKPVHRRIIYAMNELSLRHNQSYKKCARIVGECLGKYHPHGDSSVYDALVRMAQHFSLRYPIVDGQGNFGSVDGDAPAAMRYTEARFARVADYVVRDLDKNTVDFVPNFDNSLTEPILMPTVIPMLLVNGSAGIAVGMATNIPPHNLTEICRGVVAVIDNPDITIPQLNTIVKGPDFPTGGIICGRSGIAEAYATGRGKVVVRARANIEEHKNREAIVITEIPYQVNKATLLESIADLVNDKKIEGISDLRDESDKDGMRIVVELKKDAVPRVVLNSLFKYTTLQSSFGIIMLALVNNKPQVLNIKQILQHHVMHRKDVIVRRTKFELEKALRRAHILEGLRIALANLDEVIAIIRKAKSPDVAKERLIASFKLSDVQAQAILEMQLQRLTALEVDKLEAEYKELMKRIEYFRSILASEKLQEGLIKDEMNELIEKVGDERRTEIVNEAEDIEIEDMIADEEMVVTISNTGYIKRLPLSAYRKQGRGGRGAKGMATKEEDFVEHLFVSKAKDTLLVFTSSGKVFALKTWQVPEGSKISRGRAIVNLLEVSSEERVMTVMPIREFASNQFIVMATQQGVVKRTELSQFANIRRTGIIAITLVDNDTLIKAEHQAHPDTELLLTTYEGKALRAMASDVRSTGRSSQGVKGIELAEGDRVIGMILISPQMKKDGVFLFTATERGSAKRTETDEYRLQSRGGKGVIAMKLTEKTGKLASTMAVHDGDEVIAITEKGVIIRCQVDAIRDTGRATQGVKLIRVDEGDRVSTCARIVEREEEDGEAVEGTDDLAKA